jgi:hypothetical protein
VLPALTDGVAELLPLRGGPGLLDVGGAAHGHGRGPDLGHDRGLCHGPDPGPVELTLPGDDGSTARPPGLLVPWPLRTGFAVSGLPKPSGLPSWAEYWKTWPKMLSPLPALLLPGDHAPPLATVPLPPQTGPPR